MPNLGKGFVYDNAVKLKATYVAINWPRNLTRTKETHLKLGRLVGILYSVFFAIFPDLYIHFGCTGMFMYELGTSVIQLTFTSNLKKTGQMYALPNMSILFFNL